MRSAPASSAYRMVDALRVSIETSAPCRCSPARTGSTRACSASGSTGTAPGRVLSPPMSLAEASKAYATEVARYGAIAKSIKLEAQ